MKSTFSAVLFDQRLLSSRSSARSMPRLSPACTLLACAAFWLLSLPTAPGAGPNAQPSLKEAASGLFAIGVGLSDRIPEQTADWPLLLHQFSVVTPENCLKPDPVQVAEGRFNFSRADAFVDFAVSHQLSVVGHCLVWAKDDRTPAWFFRDGTNAASRETLLRRMQTHISTVAGRYRGRMVMWDVVNEALDDGTNFLRPSGWTAACGEDFIAKAFEAAHAADPKALLVYNDYNNELPAKRAKLIRLVRLLRENKAPVHAIGLQGHYEIDKVPLADIEATLVAMRELGMRVVVSELDIDVIPRSRWWADGGKHRAELAKLDPYSEGCPPEILDRQAEQYAQIFRLFSKYSDVIARVTFWNLHDGQSWLNSFPWKRVNHPLLFDRQGKPKPAFGAVVTALKEAPSGSGSLPQSGRAPRTTSPERVKVYRDLSYVPGGHERQKLDLYLPQNATNLPLIVHIHGGAFRAGSKEDGVPVAYLDQGYAIASINYRLSQHAIFPAQIQDCKAAVRWLRAHAAEYGLNPKRVAAWGASAGGHLAAMLGATGDTKEFDVGDNLEQPSSVQAVVDYFGPTDFLQMDAHRVPNGMLHDPADSPESQLIGGAIQENKTKTARANPITYITSNAPPFLICHGDADPLVPHHQSILLEAALKQAGVPVTFYTVKGGGHGRFDDPKVPALTREFLATQLK